MRWFIVVSLLLVACQSNDSMSEGERLVYVIGCVECHHQTPKQIINAPPLTVTQKYSLQEFSTLLRTGKTQSGRDLAKIGNIMGIVAVEQFSLLTNAEVRAIYNYLRNDWTEKQAAKEEAKISKLYKKEK